MKLLIFILSVILLTGCHRYYMPVNTSPTSASIKKFMEEDKIFILRDRDSEYEMRNVKMNGEDITCDLQNLAGLKISTSPRGKINYRYKPARPKSEVNKHVHIFVAKQIIKGTGGSITIPISSIYKVEELKFNKGRTTREHVGIALGVTVGIGLLLVALSQMIVFTTF